MNDELIVNISKMLLLNVSKRVVTFAEMSDERSAKMNSVIYFFGEHKD